MVSHGNRLVRIEIECAILFDHGMVDVTKIKTEPDLLRTVFQRFTYNRVYGLFVEDEELLDFTSVK